MTADEMLETHPGPVHLERAALVRAVEALAACAQTCTACADACLGEGMVSELVACVRANLDCADSCATTARVLMRQTAWDGNVARAHLQASIAACRTCGDACEAHASMHAHCRLCAEACRACEEACRDLLITIA